MVWNGENGKAIKAQLLNAVQNQFHLFLWPLIPKPENSYRIAMEKMGEWTRSRQKVNVIHVLKYTSQFMFIHLNNLLCKRILCRNVSLQNINTCFWEIDFRLSFLHIKGNVCRDAYDAYVKSSINLWQRWENHWNQNRFHINLLWITQVGAIPN